MVIIVDVWMRLGHSDGLSNTYEVLPELLFLSSHILINFHLHEIVWNFSFVDMGKGFQNCRGKIQRCIDDTLSLAIPPAWIHRCADSTEIGILSAGEPIQSKWKRQSRDRENQVFCGQK